MIDLLPDALADALGVVVADVRRECRREIEVVSAESRATIAELKAQVFTLTAALKGDADQQVSRVTDAIAAIRDGDPGRDADPQAVAEIAAKLASDELSGAIRADVAAIHAGIEEMGVDIKGKIVEQVAAAVAALPVPKDGEPGSSVDPVEVGRMITDWVNTVFAALPPPLDGKDADPAIIAEMVAAELFKLPPALECEDVRLIAIAEVDAALKAHPVPADGHTPTAEELAPIVETAVKAAVDALPRPKDGVNGVGVAAISREGARLIIELDDGRIFDAGEIVGDKGDRGKEGVGVAGALIDRSGALVVTQSDGTVLSLGPVVGSDGIDGKAYDFVPDDIAVTVGKAIRALAETPEISIARRPSSKTITTRRDEAGNLIADVVEL